MFAAANGISGIISPQLASATSASPAVSAGGISALPASVSRFSMINGITNPLEPFTLIGLGLVAIFGLSQTGCDDEPKAKYAAPEEKPKLLSDHWEQARIPGRFGFLEDYQPGKKSDGPLVLHIKADPQTWNPLG